MLYPKSQQTNWGQELRKVLKKRRSVKTSLPLLKERVQKEFNKWIRNRDKDLPCISCGKWSDKFVWTILMEDMMIIMVMFFTK